METEIKKEKKKKRLGKTQQKILMLLLGGVALGLSGTPKRYFEILKEIGDEWKDIDRRFLKRAIKNLYESKIIAEKYNKDGTTTIFLTEDGKNRALTFDLDNLKIKKTKQWDGKWRVVLFDVPEKRKNTRDALRYHIKMLGLYEFQKSVFISPYNCRNEIEYIAEINNAVKFIRFMVVDFIDNELHFKEKFGLV